MDDKIFRTMADKMGPSREVHDRLLARLQTEETLRVSDTADSRCGMGRVRGPSPLVGVASAARRGRRPVGPGSTPGKSLLRTRATIIAVAAVVAVLLGLRLVWHGPASSQVPAAQEADGSSAASCAEPWICGSAVALAEVVAFDDAGAIVTDTATALAHDGDPATSWFGQAYDDQPDWSASAEKGLGLVIDLGVATRVTGVTLTVPGLPAAVELLVPVSAAGRDPVTAFNPTDWRTIATPSAVLPSSGQDGPATVEFVFSANTRYLMVLFHSPLSEGSDGRWRAGISEISVWS
ncbi:MAG: discoidin domain-containing protein [Propionibacteriaceae bacterium]|jgi:hypothetical protein|nr:discoidin domain-containing protein [Propionibacteriaceae bacterium]